LVSEAGSTGISMSLACQDLVGSDVQQQISAGSHFRGTAEPVQAHGKAQGRQNGRQSRNFIGHVKLGIEDGSRRQARFGQRQAKKCRPGRSGRAPTRLRNKRQLSMKEVAAAGRRTGHRQALGTAPSSSHQPRARCRPARRAAPRCGRAVQAPIGATVEAARRSAHQHQPWQASLRPYTAATAWLVTNSPERKPGQRRASRHGCVRHHGQQVLQFASAVRRTEPALPPTPRKLKAHSTPTRTAQRRAPPSAPPCCPWCRQTADEDGQYTAVPRQACAGYNQQAQCTEPFQHAARTRDPEFLCRGNSFAMRPSSAARAHSAGANRHFLFKSAAQVGGRQTSAPPLCRSSDATQLSSMSWASTKVYQTASGYTTATRQQGLAVQTTRLVDPHFSKRPGKPAFLTSCLQRSKPS